MSALERSLQLANANQKAALAGTAGTPSATNPFSTEEGVREKLTAARTYYVATTGNNSNDGLTALTAFQTVQKGIDVASGLDNAGFDVTIQIADGTYNAALTLKSFVGGGKINIVGNAGTPANVVITCISNTAITANAVVGVYSLQSFKIQTITQGHCLMVLYGSIVEISNLNFGVSANNYYHITVQYASVVVTGNYTVTGNAGRHLDVQNGATFYCAGRTVTFNGTLTFSAQTLFMYALSTAYFQGGTMTVVGSVTATRYEINTNSVCYTNGAGANFIPGNLGGSTTTGGIYV